MKIWCLFHDCVKSNSDCLGRVQNIKHQVCHIASWLPGIRYFIRALLFCLQSTGHCFQVPTDAEWKGIAESFCLRWQFPNCLGAVDGKHIAIVCPPNSGSRYYNYKVKFSALHVLNPFRYISA